MSSPHGGDSLTRAEAGAGEFGERVTPGAASPCRCQPCRYIDAREALDVRINHADLHRHRSRSYGAGGERVKWASDAMRTHYPDRQRPLGTKVLFVGRVPSPPS